AVRQLHDLTVKIGATASTMTSYGDSLWQRCFCIFHCASMRNLAQLRRLSPLTTTLLQTTLDSTRFLKNFTHSKQERIQRLILFISAIPTFRRITSLK